MEISGLLFFIALPQYVRAISMFLFWPSGTYIHVYQKNYEACAIPQAQWTRAWRVGSRVTLPCDLLAVGPLDHLWSSIFRLTSAPEQKLIRCKLRLLLFWCWVKTKSPKLRFKRLQSTGKVIYFILFFKNHQMMLGQVVPLIERAKDKLKVRWSLYLKLKTTHDALFKLRTIWHHCMSPFEI